MILPPASVFAPAAEDAILPWAGGVLLAGGIALAVGRRALERCDAELRHWYDRHHGARVLD